MRFSSPYTPGAGAMPPYLAGRDVMIDTADKYMYSMVKGYPQQSVIYYGLRGVGKTVLLNAIEKRADDHNILYEHIEIAEKRSFLRQISNASKKMLHQMSAVEAAKDMGKRALGILQAFNVTYNPEDQTISAGLSETSPYVTTGILADDLTDMMVVLGKTADKAGRVVGFFIDEIQYMRDDELEALINAIHRVNQLRLPLIIFGAGLPKILRLFGEIKSYSERLFKFFPVAELSEEEARMAIVKPAQDFSVNYQEEAIQEIIAWTKGYPYFIQELCDKVWETVEKDDISAEAVKNTIPMFLEHLDQGFFKVRYDRCTKKEHDFLFAMVRCGELPCTISNVAQIMKKRVSSISPIRAQLISKGIIFAAGHGEVDFTVPLFDEYLKRINPELKFSGE